MKRRSLVLAVLLLFILAVHAQAALYANQSTAELWFDGTTAYCSGHVKSGNTSSTIEATLTLWHGNNVVGSWSSSGTGSLYFSRSCTAIKGEKYTLTLDAKVNGVSLTQRSVSSTC